MRTGLRVVISESKFDPTRSRGPLAPDTLRRYLAEKFEGARGPRQLYRAEAAVKRADADRDRKSDEAIPSRDFGSRDPCR